jgi:hypothetical protein
MCALFILMRFNYLHVRLNTPAADFVVGAERNERSE